MRTIDLFDKMIRDFEKNNLGVVSDDLTPYSSILNKCPKIRMQQVADYCKISGEKIDPVKELPNIAPPWQKFYFEYSMNYNADGKGLIIPNVDVCGLIDSLKDENGWLVVVLVSLFSDQKLLLRDIISFNVNSDGKPEITPDGKMLIQKVSGDPVEAWVKVRLENGGWPYLSPLLIGMCFCHCKAQVEMKTEEVPEKLRKKQRSLGRANVDRWHILDIEPVRKLLAVHKKSGDDGFGKALHLCRGHFKDYKNGAGLFGKYKGCYFWPQTMKGSKAYGEVTKDYNVAVPLS